MQVALGDLAGALTSYRDGLHIADLLASPIPAMPAGSAICRFRTARLATRNSIRAILPAH